jgi:hypothetical protein
LLLTRLLAVGGLPVLRLPILGLTGLLPVLRLLAVLRLTGLLAVLGLPVGRLPRLLAVLGRLTVGRLPRLSRLSRLPGTTRLPERGSRGGEVTRLDLAGLTRSALSGRAPGLWELLRLVALPLGSDVGPVELLGRVVCIARLAPTRGFGLLPTGLVAALRRVRRLCHGELLGNVDAALRMLGARCDDLHHSGRGATCMAEPGALSRDRYRP